MLQEHRHRWENRPNYFYADSGSSAGKYLNRIEEAGLARWSVSYNKWTSVLDRLASELPDSQWSLPDPADPLKEQFAWLKHQPGECQNPQRFATVRWKEEGDLDKLAAYKVLFDSVRRSSSATNSKGPRSRASAKCSAGSICIARPVRV